MAQQQKLPGGCGLVGPVHALSTLSGLHAYPRIATTASGYAVGWVTATLTQGMPTTFRVDVQLTDKSGQPMGPNVPLSTDSIAAFDPPSVSPVTGGLSIAWTRATGSSTDVVLTTLDANGQKLDANGNACQPNDTACGITAITTSGLARTPFLERPFEDQRVIGPTQDQLGVAFIDSRNYSGCTAPECMGANDVWWKKVQTNGTELTFERALTTTANARFAAPRLAFDGVHQGVVWRDVTTGTSSDLYFVAIDDMGIAQSTPFKIGSSSGTNAQSTPDLVWDGADYALSSATGTDATATVIYQRQSSNGANATSARGVTFGGSDCAPSIAFDGQAYGIVYQTSCGSPSSDLAFVRIDSTGVRYALDGTSCGASVDPSCGVVYLTHNQRQSASQPQMVYGGEGEFGIAWMETSEGTALDSNNAIDVYLQRVSCK